MDEESCITSIENAKQQLEEVTLLLSSATGEDREELEQVQCELMTILELQLKQLETAKVPATQPSVQATTATNIDEEFERFKAEIDKVTAEHEERVEDNSKHSSDVQSGPPGGSLIDDLLALEGSEVRAPFTERWGGHSYHNAVILSIVHSNEDSLLHSPKAIVLYSQPTSNAMVPCKYYLEDKCKFSQEKCKYSHGNEVDLSSLKDYIFPDMESIKKGSWILSKHKGDLWHKGEVDDALSDRSLFSINCQVCNAVLEVTPEQMLPLLEGESSKISDDSHIQLNVSTDPTDGTEFVHLLEVNANFGDWEKHTKGIGSKIMAAMGYVPGTGLGCRSDGRTEPVTTLVYPQGVSLDRCRELRTASEGRCLVDVEKHLQKAQKKAEAQLKRQEDDIRNNDVFDIINNKLSRKSGHSPSSVRKLDVSKSALQKHTVKDLNRENMQIGSHIRNLTVEIDKLRESRTRHANGTDKQAIEVIDRNLTAKKAKLAALHSAELAIRKEQTNRKDAKKMCIF